MGLGGVISNLISLGAKLIPVVSASAQGPSSSSSSLVQVESDQIEAELKQLMRLLERIKATLYDAEEREIRDHSVKLWLKELKGVAYDAEDILDEYHYEVLRSQVEERDTSLPDSRKRKLVQVPDGMLDQLQQVRRKFAEIEKDRVALRLSEEDGPKHCNNDLQTAPTSHFVVESDIIGREREKEELVDLLSSECQDGKVISVVTIVGTGGIGKTTLAQLVYNDQRIRQMFGAFGWVCISDDFNVQRLTREVLESITGRSCGLTNLSALQRDISKEITKKRVFLVLDDVWNEKRSHWELFRTPFMSASLVKILVTTRNEHVARVMQTMPTFDLSYMSQKKSWKLFQHYAFGDAIQNKGSKLVEIGKQIMMKCGMLPLAMKSVASLLRHETKEESWKEILESDLWEHDAGNEIFPSLQISYVRLPTYLKPCFLYCSMFPKDYCYNAEELVKLWIYQGYVQTDGLKNKEKVGWEYAKQLWQRSFFEREDGEKEFYFTVHDMFHDLARFNSGRVCYSIEEGMFANFPEELYHLYVSGTVKCAEPPPSEKFAALRTLIVDYCAKTFLDAFDISKAQKLRALQLGSRNCGLENPFSLFNLKYRSYRRYGSLSEILLSAVDNISLEKLRAMQMGPGKCDLEVSFSLVILKHLRYLFLSAGRFERLPECICSLYNLQNLTLNDCPRLTELPKSIGNLVSLEELIIFRCTNLTVLPVSLCQLKTLQKLCLCWCSELKELPPDIGNLRNLQLLRILYTNVSSLPIFKRIPALKVRLVCRKIGWLKDFVHLGGTLSLVGLRRVCSLRDVCCAKLASMHNLQRLILTWAHSFGDLNEDLDENVLRLYIIGDRDASSEIDSDEEENSETDDPLHSLMVMLQPHPNLKELKIKYYHGLSFPDWIGNPTLCPSLERIEIVHCKYITFLPFGSLYKLKYLKIEGCSNLQLIQAESLPLVLEEIEIICCSSLISVTGLQRLKSLVKLHITDCSKLHFCDHCRKTCIITVSSCPELKKWCLQQDIYYEGS